ncbi:MAG: hypothetical protein IT300_18210 [Dehalococcoidia bacterium]|nr:hypothetical protein [Dehalococcoidia bacterium]
MDQATTLQSPAPGTPEVVEQLRSAVEAYSKAFLTGDGRAYDMLTARCQQRVKRSEFELILAAAKKQYGTNLPIRSYDAKVSGDLARVSYTFDVAEINQTMEPWARENGSWKEDDC